MSDSMKVVNNEDGTATATVGGVSKTFPNMWMAVEWATAVLYELEGDECG
jgi:hypothetical protein